MGCLALPSISRLQYVEARAYDLNIFGLDTNPGSEKQVRRRWEL